MDLVVVTHNERPDLHSGREEVILPAWPEFMLHDAIVNRCWGRLFSEFGHFQFCLVEPCEERIAAVGNVIPFRCELREPSLSAIYSALPHGIDGILLAALEQHERGIAPNSLCALQAVVRPDLRGQGLSRLVLQAMRTLAERAGFERLVAPVRPNGKHQYPLIAMERYMWWTREDGTLFDPWMRVHASLGAKVLGMAPSSMVIKGSAADWERWTGLSFPESGEYVVPGALVPVSMDRERDHGIYREPNVWMLHGL